MCCSFHLGEYDLPLLGMLNVLVADHNRSTSVVLPTTASVRSASGDNRLSNSSLRGCGASSCMKERRRLARRDEITEVEYTPIPASCIIVEIRAPDGPLPTRRGSKPHHRAAPRPLPPEPP